MSDEDGLAGGNTGRAGTEAACEHPQMAQLDAAEVRAGVCECVAAALSLPVEGVRPEDKIITEVGGDSLDLLDITFRLEQRFGISISPRDMERRVRARLNGTPIEIDGLYTAEAMAEFRASMPEIPAEEFAEGLTVAGFPRLFRVATLMNLVTRLSGEQHG